jgi:hypothetical protein
MQTMLGGLLKSGWQNSSAEKRRLAILKMNRENTANQVIFENLALNDQSLTVRHACITQLKLAAPLFRVYQGQSEQAVKQAAKTAFCSVIGVDSQLNEADFEALLSNHVDAATLVLQHCPDPVLRVRLLNQLSQVEQADVIGEVMYAETRWHIAQQLVQLEALEIARRNLRGKDKNSEKLIRAKLDQFRFQQKRENSVNLAAEALCEQMKFIAGHPQWRPEFKGKYLLYLQRWSDLEQNPSDSIGHQFESAKLSAEVKVKQQLEIESAELNQVQICQKLARYCQIVAPLSLAELADEQLSINAVLGEALATWLANADVAVPDAQLAESFLGAQKALSWISDLIQCTSQEQIDLARLKVSLKAFSWHEKDSTPLAIAEAKTLLDDLSKQGQTQLKQHKESLDSLHKRINRLLGTSNKGDVKKAKHELAATTKAASHYTGKELKILDERLQMAAEIVSKMNDWQNFAIEPKLIELCESMEKLVESKTHPDKLAQQITKLQNSWKNLGHTDVSDDHWLRFKTAADLAYAPCATFFDQRRAAQKDNLAKREPLLEQMQSVFDTTDWDATPDYKKIEIRLREINNAWRKITDVERKAGQKQWDRLSAIRDQVYQKLDLVYDHNIEQKNQLIAQVNKLADATVTDDALDKLKLFQSRWQQIGVTRRKQDQQAWTLFRAAGDRFFEHVTESRNSKRKLEDQQLQAYRDVIDEIHSLAKSATDLAGADKQFEQLEQSYRSLPRLPGSFAEKLLERLESDFQRAGEAYSKAHDRMIQNSKDQIVDTLCFKAEICSQLESAFINNKTNLIAQLQSKIESIEITDKGLDKRFNVRLNAAADLDKSEANKSRSLLCIDLEILLDVASPEQDTSLRMQIQLDRMKNKGLGQTSIEHNKALSRAKLDWLCLPGAKPERQLALDKRFAALMAKKPPKKSPNSA